MEMELLVGLLTGPAAGIGVSVYFLNRFMSFQKDVTERLIQEIKEKAFVTRVTGFIAFYLRIINGHITVNNRK